MIYICVKAPSQFRIHYTPTQRVTATIFGAQLARKYYIYINTFYVIIISITREEKKKLPTAVAVGIYIIVIFF